MATYRYIGGNDALWTGPQSWDTGTNSVITLDNAAFGSGLVVAVASARPATKPAPSSAYSDAGAGIRVVGYDTNYGTIKVEHDQSSNGGSFLGVTVAPGSQLNNLAMSAECRTEPAMSGGAEPAVC